MSEWDMRTWSAPLADPAYRAEVWGRIQGSITNTPDGCWEWGKHRTQDGYGSISVKKRMAKAHQVALAISRGAMWSTELHIDHLCRNRCCCNPEHLELVLPIENWRRGLSAVTCPVGDWQRAKTKCPKGHSYDAKNTYVHPTKGHRMCKRCRADREMARMQRKREAA